MEVIGFWTTAFVFHSTCLVVIVPLIIIKNLRKKLSLPLGILSIALILLSVAPFYTLGMPRTMTLIEVIEKCLTDCMVIFPVVLIAAPFILINKSNQLRNRNR